MAPEVDLGKRRSIKLIFSAGVGLAVSCSSASFFLQRESPFHLERDGEFVPGDVIEFKGNYFLPRDNVYYLIPNFDFYARSTEMFKYGRRIKKIERVGNVIQGTLPEYFYDLGSLQGKDPVTDIKRDGGIVIKFYSGLGTDGKEIVDTATNFDLESHPTKGTFALLRKEFAKMDWRPADYHFFRFGAENREFNSSDTAVSPDVTILNGFRFNDSVEKKSPLAQHRDISFSLGTVPAFENAMTHPDWYDILVLISPCVMGFGGDSLNLLERLLVGTMGYNHVLKFLNERFKSSEERKRIKDSVSKFIKMGKRLIVIRSADDILSSGIEGAEEIILPSREFTNPLEAHGRPLHDELIAKFVADVIGRRVVL